jgi:hypothetical protein
MESLPIAERRGRKFPREPVNDVRIGIVVDGRGEGRGGEIFAEFFAAIGVLDQFARKGGIIRGEKIHDGGIDGEKLAGGVGLVE